MQGKFQHINGIYPIAHAKGVYVNEKTTLDKVLNGITVSVSAFGTKGDGVADDASAIQGALNSLRETGGTILFPSGTYKLMSSVTFYSNQILIFEGGAKLLRGKDDMRALLIGDGDDSIGGYDGIHNAEVIGATFDMNSFETHGCALVFSHADKLRIKDCKFRNLHGTWHYLECNGSRDIDIDSCYFGAVFTTHINAELVQIDVAKSTAEYPWAGKKDGTVCNNIHIHNCIFEGNAFSPAIGNHTDAEHKNVFVYNNTFRDFVNPDGHAGHRGALNFVSSSKGIFIHDNLFDNFSKAHIFAGKVTDAYAYNNVYINNRYAVQAGFTMVNNFVEKSGALQFVASGS